jgi:thiaminase
MRGFVGWMRRAVDAAEVPPSQRARMQTIFRDVLRYEYLFFEMAYRGESWPQ